MATGVLALVHILAWKTDLFDRKAGAWKSASGGIGIAYAFLVLMPTLAKAQQGFTPTSDSGLYGFLAHHYYLVALAGLVVYYSMDIAVERVLLRPERRPWRALAKALVYSHAGAMSGYFLLTGYLLVEMYSQSIASLVLFAGAMLAHFAAIDHGLHTKYGGLYEAVLRWVFALSTVGGAILAIATHVEHTTLALWNALFAGALIVSTIKEKVPDSSYGRIRPFMAGVLGYSILLLVLEYVGALAE